MHNVVIRAMTAADWPQVADIYAQAIAGHRATFAQEVPAYASWDSEHHCHTRLVAGIDDLVAGWVALAPSFARAVYRGVAEISIYIDNGHHRQGLGRRLLEAAAEESERHGIWTLEALIFDDNQPSLSLFQGCGYQALGVREKLGYDTALCCWRNVVLLERRSKAKQYGL